MTTDTRTRTGALAALPRRGLLAAYLLVGLANVVASGTGTAVLDTPTKAFLMPLLLVWAWLVLRERVPRLLVAGLTLAWLGDLLLTPDGDLWFMLGLVAFLGMQVCYILGFRGLGSWTALRSRLWLPVGYGVLWAALNVALGPQLGDLRIPLLVYSLFLVTMAASAAGVSGQVGVGGALFLVSDLMIGLDAADIHVPGYGYLVMTTYVLAQLLIVTGWVTVVRTGGQEPAGAQPHP